MANGNGAQKLQMILCPRGSGRTTAYILLGARGQGRGQLWWGEWEGLAPTFRLLGPASSIWECTEPPRSRKNRHLVRMWTLPGLGEQSRGTWAEGTGAAEHRSPRESGIRAGDRGHGVSSACPQGPSLGPSRHGTLLKGPALTGSGAAMCSSFPTVRCSDTMANNP